MIINYFCVHHKNRWKHNLQFKTAIFQNKFTLWHIRLSIYIWKTKFTSYKQNFFGLLFWRNAKKTDTDHSILQPFYSVSKEVSHKPLKVQQLQKSISQVCLSLIQLTSMNVFSTM